MVEKYIRGAPSAFVLRRTADIILLLFCSFMHNLQILQLFRLFLRQLDRL